MVFQELDDIKRNEKRTPRDKHVKLFYLSREDSHFCKWWSNNKSFSVGITISDWDKRSARMCSDSREEYVSFRWPESRTKSPRAFDLETI